MNTRQTRTKCFILCKTVLYLC